MLSLRGRAAIVSIVILLVVLGFWELSYRAAEQGAAPMDEYEMLLAGVEDEARLPVPSEIIAHGIEAFKSPFYDNGPNDKGIGLQLLYSLQRVLTGYGLAVLVAIPLGFLLGMSPLMYRALNPYVQLLRPVSPLAWMPLALFVIRDSNASAVFVIFICSIWPMLVNTAFGVASVNRDYLNVARTLELGRFRTAIQVILPAASPTILTGMRISIGISWLVIVAAEMLVGGTGIGYYVWNQWNNLDLTSIIFSILLIGVVGLMLDTIFDQASKRVAYE
jgi:nitrate/nitrite transport system permease protein